MQLSGPPTSFWTLITIAVVSGVLVFFAFKNRKTAHIPALLATLITISIWNISTAITYFPLSVPVGNTLAVLNHITAAVAATNSLSFGLQYLGHWKPVRHWLIPVLTISPLIQAGVILTNPLHQFIWDTSLEQSLLLAPFGTWHYALYMLNFILLIISAAFLLHTAITCPPIYRWQARLTLTGIAFPLIAYLLNQIFCPTSLDICVFLPILSGVAGFFWFFASFRIHASRNKDIWEFDLLYHLKDGFLIVNDEGVVIYSNPAFLTQFNMTALQTLGVHVEKLIPEIRELLLHPPSLQPIIHEIKKDNAYYRVQIQDLITLENEREAQFITFSDITKLRKSEERSRSMLDQQAELVLRWQPDKVVTYVNESYARFHGKTKQELIGSTISDLVTGTEYKNLNESIQKISAQGSTTYERTSITHQVERKWIAWNNRAIYDENGEMVEILSVGRDITDRRRAEQGELMAREISDTLRKISIELSRSLKTEEILNNMLDLIAPLIPYDSANFLQVKGNKALTTRGRGYEKFGPEAVRASEKIELVINEIHNLRWMRDNKQALRINDVSTDPNWTSLNDLSYIESWLGAPVFIQGKIAGYFSLDSAQRGFFTDEHLHYLSVFANQAGLALENAQLYETAWQRAREAETLQNVAKVINSSLNQQEIFAIILEKLADVISYDSASILLKNAKGTEIVGGRGFENLDAVLGIQFPHDDTSPNTVVLETREPYILDDAPAHYDAFTKPPHNHIHGWMGIPLIFQDRVIGLLVIDSKQKDRFTEEDARLASAFASHVAITVENARLFQETRRLSITDPLTNCFNRRYFFEHANREKDRSNRFDRPMALIMLDLDYFKAINDRLGHRAGDQVLINVVKIVQSELRTIDTLGRYGGEEFAILLPESNSDDATTVAERIRQKLEETTIENEKDSVFVTASFGVVVHTPPEDISIDALLDRADRAMYIAKRSGRNRVHLWRMTN